MADVKSSTEKNGEYYRQKFWGDPDEQKEITSDCYTGFFTHENILKWSESINDKDVVYRLGYTLGFSKLSVDTFTGVFNVDYDKRSIPIIQSAFYDFVVNFLYLNPNETDFRFYRRLRKVLQLSSLRLETNIYRDVINKEEQKRTFHQQTLKNKIGRRYTDFFMKWIEEKIKLNDFKDLFKCIHRDPDIKLEHHKNILCVDDVNDYIEKNAEVNGDKEKSTQDKEQHVGSGPEYIPKYDNKSPPLIDSILLKTIKIYSTIRGFLKEDSDEIINKYEQHIYRILPKEMLSSFFLIDRNLKPRIECFQRKEYSNQPLIELIAKIDSCRCWKGDILRVLRNDDVEGKYPDCPWLRNFLVLYNFYGLWSKEKFILVFDNYFTKKNFKWEKMRKNIVEETESYSIMIKDGDPEIFLKERWYSYIPIS